MKDNNQLDLELLEQVKQLEKKLFDINELIKTWEAFEKEVFTFATNEKRRLDYIQTEIYLGGEDGGYLELNDLKEHREQLQEHFESVSCAIQEVPSDIWK